jgi:hypothetical protein
MPEHIGQSVVIPSHVCHVEDDLKHVIVMNTQSGQIFGLDNSAAMIWATLADSGSESAAVVALTAQYGIPREHAEGDVRGFVDTLVEAGLLAHGVRNE